MLYALDIETTGLNPRLDSILCIGVWSKEESRVFRTLDEFRAWHSSDRQYIAHNGSFDFNWLRYCGLDIRPSFVYDTRTITSLLCPRPTILPGQKSALGLENLVQVVLGEQAYKLDRISMSDYSYEEVAAYCLKDCELTYRLFERLVEQVDWAFVESWVMPATKLIMDMEYDGIRIDVAALGEYKDSLHRDGIRLERELNETAKEALQAYRELQIVETRKRYAEMLERALLKAKDPEKAKARYAQLEANAIEKIEPFNWSSPKQMLWLLQDFYQLDIVRRKLRMRQGQKEFVEAPCTDDATLKELDHPVAKKLIEYRKAHKLYGMCGTLQEHTDIDQRIRPRFNIGGTVTGRLSSSSPNMQQCPRNGPIRSFFTADPGHVFVSSDLGQIEPRMIAEASRDEKLITHFNEGHDIYSVLGLALFGPESGLTLYKSDNKFRDCAKTLALACFYGVGARKFTDQINKDLGIRISMDEARFQIQSFLEQFPAIVEFTQILQKQLENRQVAYNFLGRPIYLESNEYLRKALNLYIQGSASDLLVYATFKHVLPELRSADIPARCSLLIHDQVVLQVPENAADQAASIVSESLTTKTQESLRLDVPLVTDTIISKEWTK